MWNYLLVFAAGLILLIKGADIVVKYASRTARLLGISNFMIGLTLVAFSTTLPELSVSLMSAFSGVVDIAVGTTLGSIIANSALILALAAVFVPLATNMDTLKLKYILLLSLLVLSLLLIDGLVWYEGLVLIIIFAVYMGSMIRKGRGTEPATSKEKTKTQQSKGRIAKYIAFTIFGGVLVVVGARFLIDSTIDLSTVLGVPEMLIAIIAVAIGTSLPELAVVTTAAFKKIVGISIGDILGANMFNVMVLGATSLVSPVPVTAKVLTIVIPIVLIVNVLLLLFMSTKIRFISKKWQLSRTEGLILLAIYAIFVALQFI
ncbi:MAG: calcium/sodium antiporter [Candidatus Aenigmatarchaeota archaeon]|nr:MAG: calcium/sodium antiporter [Candidatus Aenigmarchaeota archaeon]